MKRLLILLSALLVAGIASAQSQNGAQMDSVVFRPGNTVDSTLVGQSIFDLMPAKDKGAAADVKIHQSQAIRDGLSRHIAANPDRTLSGYRVRIFFDNQQNARNASMAAMNKFIDLHYGIAAYRSYQNPFFKVTVGDFRTRSEAMELLQRIKNEFPTAFVVKENINFPAVESSPAFHDEELVTP